MTTLMKIVVVLGMVQLGVNTMARAEDEMSLLLQEMLNGGLVNKPELAASISELLIENAFGEGELARQQPLIVTDHGDRWLIEGSLNKDRDLEGPGPVSILMRKTNAEIVDFHRRSFIGLPSDFERKTE